VPETPTPFDVDRVRRDFPILSAQVDGRPLVYLDNGATTQKPTAVLDATDRFYRAQNANIHRAVHRLSQVATDAFETARLKVQRFLNAPDRDEVIFTRGTTESINLVAASLGAHLLTPGDEVLLTELEHHSNIVPWQLAAARHGAFVRALPITDSGELRYDLLGEYVTPRTRIVALTHTSNALGTNNDVKRIIAATHAVGAKVLVDGAQWVGHAATDVQDLGVDFYVFSGHKLFGPTGIGVLWGRRELLEAMPPYQGGGDMIRTVSFERTTYAELPNKFEAGTANIAGAVGLGAAIDYLAAMDRRAAHAHEQALLARATERLSAIPGLRIVGTAADKASVVSFVMDDPPVDPHTLGTLLDGEGIAVRTGHHCCMPLMTRLGLPGTCRASFSFYNTHEEVDALVAGIGKIRASFAKPTAPAPKEAAPRLSTDVRYAPATAESPALAAQQLIEDFELFDDWEQKNEYLIELGQKIPPMPAELKIEPHRVHGCQSTVHLAARAVPDDPTRIEFLADSDAIIVRGLVALLEAVYSGQRAADVLAFDVNGFLERLGLNHHLSMGRRNGLAGMVTRLRAYAKAIAAGVTLDRQTDVQIGQRESAREEVAAT